MDKVQALHQFWSSFDIKAYDESTVPDDIKMPYLTYEVNIGDYGEDMPCSVSLWYYDRTWDDIDAKAEEIDNALKNGGVSIAYDGGSIWIKKDSRRRLVDENDMIRHYIINTIIEYH